MLKFIKNKMKVTIEEAINILEICQEAIIELVAILYDDFDKDDEISCKELEDIYTHIVKKKLSPEEYDT